MVEPATPVELAELVARIAAALHIQTALVGAYALAAHHYVRGTKDIDLATTVPFEQLGRLQRALEAAGLQTLLRSPDVEDPLGGVLVVWTRSDEAGEPIDPVEVINFVNPHRPRPSPAIEAIRNAIGLAEKPALRYPRLADLIALKLDAGGLRDQADVVELLVRNPDADLEQIRSTCKRYGLDRIDELIEQACRRPGSRLS